jgi:hypothetical protein
LYGAITRIDRRPASPTLTDCGRKKWAGLLTLFTACDQNISLPAVVIIALS